LIAVIVVAGVVFALAAGLAAETDDSCSRTMACKNHGRCSSLLGFCVADSDIDCAVSDACKLHGLCRVQSGVCVAGSASVGR